ncbi:hypothetical protein KTN05_06480 [Paracoccus sp. Z118]|uniref:hypothetical protein n=1 Tax=Paracoccus sp. Z118 TaxID=2851017 RepID=UPI001C2C4A13|nr:hypothetical protein [Paracoccus sp. Z118]MBV0891501.1 hypothetical protein [Paracoccus sp. Z118]
MKRLLTTVCLLSAMTLAACADKSAEIAPVYVAPSKYAAMNCQQLTAEATTVSSHARRAMEVQDRKAGNDAAAVAVGTILFWPALFFIKGDGAGAAEVAQLKGDMQAIEAVNRARNCGITFAE